MAHVDDGQLNALLDGELSPEAARDVTNHVATCAECARRLEDARAFLSEAGELLAVLTPPPRAAEPASADVAPPLIAKTSKEIAVSVDGRTEMTPAIRPVFKHEVPAPAPRRRWTMPDLEKLAWAASLVLCLGVGYLANEVYHLRTDGRTDRPTGMAVNPAAPTAPPALGSTDDRSRAERAPTQSTPASARQSVGPSVRRSVGPPAERPPNVSPPRIKPPVTKPAPAFARPAPEQLASNAPVAPVAAPPAAATQPSRGALGDMAGAAPSAARDAAGAGARTEGGRANALEEAAVTAPSSVAARAAAPTAFRRTTMEEAVRQLGGSIRLIDGMNPSRVEVGPGRLVPGANPDRDVVRVAYSYGTQRLLLDQQLGDPAAGASYNGLMPGDTLVTALGSNGTQVRWLDRKIWLSLTGELPADSVRVLVERIR